MSELHNTNPSNWMQNNGVAKVLILKVGGGQKLVGQRNEQKKMGAREEIQ